MIKIICDSTSDIPPEIARQLDITIIPMSLHIGDKVYRDWLDITPDKFFDIIRQPDVKASSAQITPGQFEATFKKFAGDTVICITMSSAGSGTHQAAVLAKKMMLEADSAADIDIEIIDSMSFAYPYGIAVVEGAKLAKQGASKQDVIKKIHDVLERVVIYFLVEDLNYLKKGGRINLAQAVIGNILNIKPMLTIKDGLIMHAENIRGTKNAIRKMVEAIKNKGYQLANKQIVCIHSACPEKIPEVRQAFTDIFDIDADIITTELGSVIGVHTGPGVVGILFIND